MGRHDMYILAANDCLEIKRCELTTETANQQQKQCIDYQQKRAESSSYVHLCENKKGYPPPFCSMIFHRALCIFRRSDKGKI